MQEQKGPDALKEHRERVITVLKFRNPLLRIPGGLLIRAATQGCPYFGFVQIRNGQSLHMLKPG